MSIDAARLARIRLRVLAAAAIVAVPACGSSQQHVNERNPEPPHVNQAAPDKEPTPTNDRHLDQPTTAPPEPKHINTPAPQSAVDLKADDVHVNRPNPDAQPKKAPTLAEMPPTGQTINVASRDDEPPQHINIRTQEPPPATKK